MSKAVEVSVRVHKPMPACCRASLVEFAKHDRYMGGGEPGDRVGCGCGNTLVYAFGGKGGRAGLAWHVASKEEETREGE